MTQANAETRIKAEAFDWLLRLDPRSPCQDEAERNAAFSVWVKRSPSHLRWYLVYAEAEQRLIDPVTVAQIALIFRQQLN